MRLKHRLSLGIDLGPDKIGTLPDNFRGSGSAKLTTRRNPLVSVLLPTFNRPLYLAQALDSVVRQNYRNLQIIVANDGGCDVAGIVEPFNDRRILFINRKENRGLPFTLNEALREARGKYVCYLGDDDIYYPNHVGTLVNALESHSEYLAAYSDLYKVYCKVNPDQGRTALSKVVEVSRDFDPFLMLYFNNVLHVSLMHRRDLLEKTGLYNEKLNVMIDWDMTRRLAFFTDFLHVHQITGEYYHPAGDCDRISVQQRKNQQEYARNVLTIRTTRPAKPWTKFADLSIILILAPRSSILEHRESSIDYREVGTTIGLIWQHTFYPYKLYIPLPDDGIGRFKTDMPNVVTIPVAPTDTPLEQIEKTLAQCEGQYIAIVPAGFPVRDMWVEDSLYALINSQNNREAFELEGSSQNCQAVVARREHIELACKEYPRLQLYEGLMAGGIKIRRITPEEIPFQFDTLLKVARTEQNNGNLKQAARIYVHIANKYQNQLWMKSLAAQALFKAGVLHEAAKLVSSVNGQRPTVDTLLLEAKLSRKGQNFESAITLLNKAHEILLGKGLPNEQGRFIPAQSR
ncbi:MAG: glycosyltransferase [Sedimentisphaerales bacterium]